MYFKGNFMMFLVIGVNAIQCHDNRPISLIGINRRGTDASVSIDSRENQRVRLKTREQFI